MTTIKNGQISLYCYFNKIIKCLKLISSIQHWFTNILEMFVIHHTSIWLNFILVVLRSKRNKYKFNSHYVAIPMMTSQNLKSTNFNVYVPIAKSIAWNLLISQKHKNLDISRINIFLQIKKQKQGLLYYTSRVTLLQKIVL